MRLQDSCPSCGAKDFDLLHRLVIRDVFRETETELRRTNNYKRNHLLFDKLLLPRPDAIEATFHLCRRCGLIFFSPRPDDADLNVKYNEIVVSRETERREQAFELVDLRGKRAREIFLRLRPYIREPLEVALDIGGADGHCLAGFSTSTDRVVLDYEERQMWPGVRRVGRTLDDLDDDSAFDLVLCCHTLEHIDLLNEFIKKVYKRTKPGGLLYVEVPLGCNGEIYRTGNLLTHLNFFSPASLAFLLDNNGYCLKVCRAGPVLSKKRYLPVVVAIARRPTSARVFESRRSNAYEETRKETTRRAVDRRVLLANAVLVLSQPVKYSRAFLRMRR